MLAMKRAIIDLKEERTPGTKDEANFNVIVDGNRCPDVS